MGWACRPCNAALLILLREAFSVLTPPCSPGRLHGGEWEVHCHSFPGAGKRDGNCCLLEKEDEAESLTAPFRALFPNPSSPVGSQEGKHFSASLKGNAPLPESDAS